MMKMRVFSKLALGIALILGGGVGFADEGKPDLKDYLKEPVKSPTELVKSEKSPARVKVGSFNGPTKPVPPDRTAILDFDGTLGDDPQFKAEPKVESIRVLKDFTGKLVLLVTPGDDNAGKTIVVVYADTVKDATTNKNKTVLETFSFPVAPLGPTPPTPPGPGPGPGPTPPVPDDATKLKFFNDLKAAYLVSPNADDLAKLIEVYTEMGNTTFTKRSDAATVLKNITAKKLPQYTQLRKVRDTVQALLDKEIGNADSDPFDQAKFKQFWTDVTVALAAIKAGK